MREHSCVRCWQIPPRGERLLELRVVDLDIARELAGTSTVYICRPCLILWRAFTEGHMVGPTQQEQDSGWDR